MAGHIRAGEGRHIMRRLLAITLAMAALSGCMTITDLPVTVQPESAALTARGPVTTAALGEVTLAALAPIFDTGAQLAPEVIRGKLNSTLQASRIFGSDTSRPVNVAGTVLASSIPGASFGGFPSSLTIRYTARSSAGTTLLDETVTSSGQDDTGSFLGDTRYRRSMSVTVANNITLFRGRLRKALAEKVAAGVLPGPKSPRMAVAAAEAEPAPPPPPARFPLEPLAVAFTKAPQRPDDVAVIIGNADYTKLGKDIPDVIPAYADAESFRRYLIQAAGVREGNIIQLRDATGTHLTRVFGSERTHRGQLFDWVRKGRSRVWVYYAGHGAPGGADGGAYLVPSDADGNRIDLNGYPLTLLYENLSRLPAVSITVVLEACFSGASQGGSVVSKASPIHLKPKTPPVPDNVTVIAAGAADQIASWEQDSSHGLFTKYLLKGLGGEADAKPYGDGDGTVGWTEVGAYLEDTLTYQARRHYGRDQTAQFVNLPAP